jgi:hypothetical protein
VIAEIVLTHPLTAYDPMGLLASGDRLPLTAIDLVTNWAKGIGPTIPDGGLLAPRAGMKTLRGFASSLVTLGEDSKELIRASYSTYRDAEHVAPAALFLAMELVIRQRATLAPAVAATAEVEAMAKARGWTTIEDVTGTLLLMEQRLVKHGSAVLRFRPDLEERFVADDAVRTYEDTQADIRRRLDFMVQAEFKLLFDESGRTAPLVTEAENLSRDANRFRAAREGRQARATELTAWRNILFTAYSGAVTHLQTVLRASLEDTHPELLARVEGEYWRNIARLGRRASSSEDESTEPPTEPAAAPEPSGEDGSEEGGA